MSSDGSCTTRARRRAATTKSLFMKVTKLEEEVANAHVKLDLVLGGLATIMDKRKHDAVQSTTSSSSCTPLHRLGYPSHHEISPDIIELPIMTVPSFPFPAVPPPDVKLDVKHEPEVTPRIDMSLFLPGDITCVSNAVGSTMKKQPHADLYDDVDGFLDAEEKSQCNVSYGSDCVDGGDETIVAKSDLRKTNVGVGVDQNGVGPDLCKASLEADYRSSDDSSLSDSSDHYDWSNDPEYIAFINGTWHPDS